MMKHITAALYAVIVALSTAGCAQNSADTVITESTAEVTEINSEIQTEAQTKSLAPAEVYLNGLENEEDMWYSSDERYSEIVEVLKKEYHYSRDVQGVFIVADDEDIIFFAGMNSYESDGITKVGPYTTYEIGSVTKMFTASCVLLLCEQGKMSLDDTLGKYWPEYEIGADITIYQLLHMQSGIHDFEHTMSDFVNEDTPEDLRKRADCWEVKAQTGEPLTDEDFLELVSHKKLNNEPGTVFEYSNTNYKLLAMIVEMVSGQSFADFVKENIFDKCGMEHSSIAAVGDVTSVPRETVYPHCTYTHFIRGAGDMHSCAADLIAFDRALMAGDIINDESLEKMFTIDKGYGCGLEPWKGPLPILNIMAAW